MAYQFIQVVWLYEDVLMGICLMLFVSAGLVVAERWEGSLSDVASKKQQVNDHPVSCLIGCSGGGFGLVLADGSFLKFDASGE